MADASLSSDPGPAPLVSVVVVAHTRREFLREALDSVRQQDVPRDQVEIVVVKNFRDASVDDQIRTLGGQSILSPDLAAGPKFAAGVRATRAAILTFLDYDDQYEPRRLRTVLAAFRAHPDLGFYHNQFSYIGPDGGPLARDTIRAFRLPQPSHARTLFLENAGKIAQSRRLAGQLPDFNSSSCAVSRSIAEATLPYLSRVHVASDTLLFFAALAGPGSILIDADALTRYRIHGENSTSTGPGSSGERLARLQGFAARASEDYRVTRECVARLHGGRVVEIVDARIWVNDLARTFRSTRARRRDFVRLLGSLPRFATTFPVREDLLGVIGIAPFLASPALGRTLYHRQMSVR